MNVKYDLERRLYCPCQREDEVCTLCETNVGLHQNCARHTMGLVRPSNLTNLYTSIADDTQVRHIALGLQGPVIFATQAKSDSQRSVLLHPGSTPPWQLPSGHFRCSYQDLLGNNNIKWGSTKNQVTPETREHSMLSPDRSLPSAPNRDGNPVTFDPLPESASVLQEHDHAMANSSIRPYLRATRYALSSSSSYSNPSFLRESEKATSSSATSFTSSSTDVRADSASLSLGVIVDIRYGEPSSRSGSCRSNLRAGGGRVTYDKRRYPCQRCGERFVYPKDLKRHQESVHEANKYSCPKSCLDVTFSRLDNLKRHLIKSHGMTKDLAKETIEEAYPSAREQFSDTTRQLFSSFKI